MYKLLLSWRYLRTRYIALVSIVSVTLGVATMIVVNSVMAGFSHEMQARMHGIIGDIVFESHSMEGFYDPKRHIDEIRRVVGPDLVGVTPTVHMPAMLILDIGGKYHTQQVMFIGIDPATYATVSEFGDYLQHPENRQQLSFALREGGYDVIDHQAEGDAHPREAMRDAGWKRRQLMAAARPRRVAPPSGTSGGPADPFQERNQEQGLYEDAFDPAREQHSGVVLGIALASIRDHNGKELFLSLPGDDVRVVIPKVPTPGSKPTGEADFFTIVDFYESKMSEYDSSFAFVSLQKLQEMRGTGDYCTSIQLSLRPGADLNVVRDRLRAHFPPQMYGVYTWQDKQGPLLAAVNMETAILNVLLFMIIAVAGFGILAIFYMIVVEKTRDIGVLKSLGASGQGIMGIFLTYGLSLGIVGGGVGMTLGLLFVHYINEIADGLGRLTGRPVFDPSIYYFQKIPTIVDPFTVSWIVAGAMAIAVLASVLPARRAARLHPVEALRYE
jgi:lipoprotein-releasing system permease protein